MYCKKCGTQNDDNAWQCLSCGTTMQGVAAAQPGMPTRAIPNYLVQSILVTILCCWPFGIPAIVFAAKVNGLLVSGDVAGAQDASNKAKMWCWISFGLGLFGIIAYVAVMAIGIIADS